MTGKDILSEEFERAGMRGYRADEVDAFLQKIAQHVDEKNEKNEDLTYKLQILADKIEEYKKDEESIRDALLGAQKLGSSILNEAKEKAEAISNEAKRSSEALLMQAKSKVEQLTKDSLQKANNDINSIKKEMEFEQRKLELMKQEVSAFRSSILKQYKSHLDILSNLPDFEEKQLTFSKKSQPAEPEKQQEKETTKQVETQTPTQEKQETDKTQDTPKKENEKSKQKETKKADTTSKEITLPDDKSQTIEFDNDVKLSTAPLDLNEDEKQKINEDFKKRLKKTTSYAEKFGDLAFGSHKDRNF